MRRPRHLSQEERALWDSVAHRTTPLDADRARTSDQNNPKEDSKRQPREKLPRFEVSQSVKVSPKDDLLPSIVDRLAAAPVQMDHRSFTKLKRGKLKPEARLDLHGMTISQAHPELIRFIMGSSAMGRRLVLVITGKGKDRDDGGPIPIRHGVLRHQVPQWLALAPLGPLVLQVTPAHIRHGGEGAYYVYLRRGR